MIETVISVALMMGAVPQGNTLKLNKDVRVEVEKVSGIQIASLNNNGQFHIIINRWNDTVQIVPLEHNGAGFF